jgi:pimeloyl-ACP methyl ester carboxylesterase
VVKKLGLTDTRRSVVFNQTGEFTMADIRQDIHHDPAKQSSPEPAPLTGEGSNDPAVRKVKHLRPSDLRAAAQLATQATRGITSMVEEAHQAVWSTLGVPASAPGKTRGITGFVFRAVHGITELVGKGLERAFTELEPLLESLMDEPPETPQREAVLSALNGVLGDQLLANNNPLATPMTLRYQGKALNLESIGPLEDAGGKVLLLIHGSCMNDLQWHTRTKTLLPDGTAGAAIVLNHGDELAKTLGYTPIYLRYNSGRHTSENGRELSILLEKFAAQWPTAITELSVVVHSMGGLVMRSAVHYGQQNACLWTQMVKKIVFLGTPHHGSPLERIGNWVDVLLDMTPYSRPYAKLGQLRSTGITDLRYGHVVDEDWLGRDRFQRSPDTRIPMPLPSGIACFTIAASTAADKNPLAERTIGDGLVPLPSALGQHSETQYALTFAPEAQRILYSTNHMELLSSPAVTQQLVQWLQPAT